MCYSDSRRRKNRIRRNRRSQKTKTTITEDKHLKLHEEFLNYVKRTSIEIDKGGGVDNEVLDRVLKDVLDCRKTSEFLFSSFMNNLAKFESSLRKGRIQLWKGKGLCIIQK